MDTTKIKADGYTNASNAKRAAKAANCAEFTVVKENERYFVRTAGFVKSQQKAPEAPAKAAAPAVTEAPVRERKHSTTPKPTKKVWDVADSMPGATRQEVLHACKRRGITYNTASTQYYHWCQLQAEMQAAKEAKKSK